LVGTSTRLVESSRKLVEISRRLVESSRKLVEIATRLVESSRKLVEISTRFVESSRKLVEISTKLVEISTRLVESSTKSVESSTKQFQQIFSSTVHKPMLYRYQTFIFISSFPTGLPKLIPFHSFKDGFYDHRRFYDLYLDFISLLRFSGIFLVA
jgi:hypothetical protein